MSGTYCPRTVPSHTVSRSKSMRKCARIRSRLPRRQGEVKLAALAGLAFSPDSAAVLLHQAATEGQTEAGAADVPRIRRVALLEAIEDLVKLFDRDAAA